MAHYNELEMYKLFESMKYFVFCTGGDGDGWFVTKDPFHYADLFDKYERLSVRPYFLYRDERAEGIFFSSDEQGQDSIAFISDRKIIYRSAYKDIIVEIA